MPVRIVKQPNGLLARFSTIVDDFTHVNMTHEEATRVLLKDGCSHIDVALKITRALDDVLEDETRGDGLGRWRDALDDIQNVHGKKVCAERERAGSK